IGRAGRRDLIGARRRPSTELCPPTGPGVAYREETSSMVVLGVDPHKQTYTVVAVDQTGRQLAQLTVSARTDGQLRLLGWARQLPLGQGGERRWAVEDGRQVAGRLVAQLLRAGEAVVWVPPKLMAN